MKRRFMYEVDVTRVIDGDTFEGDIDLGLHTSISKQRFRLLGVDTPERKEEGYFEATEYTAQMVEGKKVLVESFDRDSFGRILVMVYVDDVCLNEKLLQENLAVVFKK